MGLDLSKPHGVIYGESRARYEQGGVMYDAAGRVVDDATGNVATDYALAETGITTTKPGVATSRRGGSHKTPVTQ